jgi:hypothetical protein
MLRSTALAAGVALSLACASGEDVQDVGPAAGGTAGASGSGGASAGGSAGWASGGSGGSQAGAGGGGASGTGGTGGSAFGGASGSAPDAASDGSAGSGGSAGCVPEICNGADDDCNGTSDDGVCGPGCSGAVFGGKAYAFCNVQTSWSAAVAACTVQKMSLVRIDAAAEDAWIRSTATTRGLAAFWIGAGDAAAEGQWTWLDGTQFWSGGSGGTPVGGLYENWQGGEPNDDGTEDCAAVGNDGTWVDTECGNNRDYVCRQ